jgi:ABC-type Fe3+ transport system substrate-binding protein
VIKASGKQEAARQFTDFVLSEKGWRLLEQYGYQKPLLLSHNILQNNPTMNLKGQNQPFTL